MSGSGIRTNLSEILNNKHKCSAILLYRGIVFSGGGSHDQIFRAEFLSCSLSLSKFLEREWEKEESECIVW